MELENIFCKDKAYTYHHLGRGLKLIIDYFTLNVNSSLRGKLYKISHLYTYCPFVPPWKFIPVLTLVVKLLNGQSDARCWISKYYNALFLTVPKNDSPLF